MPNPILKLADLTDQTGSWKHICVKSSHFIFLFASIKGLNYIAHGFMLSV